MILPSRSFYLVVKYFSHKSGLVKKKICKFVKTKNFFIPLVVVQSFIGDIVGTMLLINNKKKKISVKQNIYTKVEKHVLDLEVYVAGGM